MRRGYGATNRGDIEEAVDALAAPDCEFIPAGLLPGVEEVYRGPEGFRRLLNLLWETFDNPRLEVYDLVDAGDQVLATVTNLAGES
ncbi:MAG TPA: nuclear transport factor 2 family protein [Thermoleophilaceae bacterium]|nr:nuclear transport factor 2 family protein [Thermoleophilaceae bacterium]